MAKVLRDWRTPQCGAPFKWLSYAQQSAFQELMRTLPKRAGTGAVSSPKYAGCLALDWKVPESTRVLTISYRYKRIMGLRPTYTFVCLDWG
jgi:hypothetical protein